MERKRFAKYSRYFWQFKTQDPWARRRAGPAASAADGDLSLSVIASKQQFIRCINRVKHLIYFSTIQPHKRFFFFSVYSFSPLSLLDLTSFNRHV